MIPVFPLLGWEYARKKRDAWRRMDMWVINGRIGG